MNSQDQLIITGIDIGTSSVRVVIAREDPETGSLAIIGTGQSRSRGLRKGSVISPNDAHDAIAEALESAEIRAGIKVDAAVVNVNGTHISGNGSKGIVAINTPNKEITFEELERVRQAAMVVNLPPNREILHVFSKDYRVDGQSGIHNPAGMHGVRLEVDAHVVTASTPAIKHLDQIFEDLQIRIDGHALSGIGGFKAVMGQDQIENGAVYIDIGATTTNIAVAEEGDLVHVAVLPVGGVNVTNDLAIGLQTELQIAETLKLQYTPHDNPALNTGNTRIKVGRKDHIFARADVEMIMKARMEELFELVDSELIKADKSGQLPGGAVLVGGGSLLHGIDQTARSILKLPARVGSPGDGMTGVKEELMRPEFTNATGLMIQHYAALAGTARQKSRFNVSGASGALKGAGETAGKGLDSFKSLLGKFLP